MDFQTFIKRYTFVDSEFINDFFNIIGENYIERYTEFIVDSELLRKWLVIGSKSSFNDMIKRSYQKNKNYTIKKVKLSDVSDGNNCDCEIIKLTPETAKKICMNTESKKGDEIRQYFIDLELALYKYNKYIIDGMNKKIQQLENNQIKTKKKLKKNSKIINKNDDNEQLYLMFSSK